MRRSRTRTVVFLAASIPALAMLAASIAQPALGGDTGAALGGFLGSTCHRLPQRCLPLPWGPSGLCARCTAFWAGVALSAALFGASGRGIVNPLSGLLLVLPMAADGTMQQLGLYESIGLVRVLTGLAGGWGTGVMVVWLADLVPGERSRTVDAGRGVRGRGA